MHFSCYFFCCQFPSEAYVITTRARLNCFIHASPPYQWSITPLIGEPRRQSRPLRRTGHAHVRRPRRAVGDDVIGSVNRRDGSRNVLRPVKTSYVLQPPPTTTRTRTPSSYDVQGARVPAGARGLFAGMLHSEAFVIPAPCFILMPRY